MTYGYFVKEKRMNSKTPSVSSTEGVSCRGDEVSAL